jgi:hypothetical protein
MTDISNALYPGNIEFTAADLFTPHGMTTCFMMQFTGLVPGSGSLQEQTYSIVIHPGNVDAFLSCLSNALDAYAVDIAGT